VQGLRGRLTLSEVVIIDADPGRIARLENCRLWYFGSDYAQLLALSAAKNSSCTIHPAGDAVNAVASRLRGEFLDLDERLFSGRCPQAWEASDIAERNPLTSDLFLDVCRGVALVEAARGRDSHVVVVDDPSFGRALATLCRRAGTKARWLGGNPSRLRRWWFAAMTHWRFLRGWWSDRAALRAVRKPVAPSDIMLMTWMDRRTFAGGELSRTDRFFGPLPGWLQERDVRIGWLGNVLGPVRDAAVPAARVARHERLVLTAELCGWADLVGAYASLLGLPMALRRRAVLDGVDVTPLVRRALGQELMSTRLVGAALYRGLARHLRRLGLAPRVLLYTYENQPWEKAMIAGFRRASPSTRLVGVQHAPFAENYLCAFPSRRQWREGPVPDLLVTIGEDFRDRLLALGAPRDAIAVGGALRYTSSLAAQSGTREAAGGSRLVLAACSIDARESLELAHKAADATTGLDGVRLAVNFHPMVDEKFRTAIRERIGSLCDCRHVDFVEGSAEKWLGQASIVLYNASGTAFEAVAQKIPAVFVGSEMALDLDKMAGQGGLHCRDVCELRRIVSRLLDDTEFRRASMAAAQSHLRQCFTAPTAQFWSGLANGQPVILGSAA
jgi:surface carbohydrate biosynthesis protein (TIGR04326 family)